MRKLTPNERWLLAAILILAAALRIAFNDVTEYSPADEAIYVADTQQLLTAGFVSGYPELVRSYLQDRTSWRYPSPLRWGHFALTSAAAVLQRGASPRALASLSTAAGIVVIPLVFLLALELLGSRVALLASALTAVSSIELALGRRALQDEVFCCCVTLALLLFVRAMKKPSFGSVALAVGSLTFCFAIKESFFYLYPAFIAMLLFYRKPQHLLLFAIPPVIDYAVFSILARSATAFFELASVVSASMTAPYVLQYQGGPPHRLLFDFVIVAPLVTFLAVAAVIAAVRERGEVRGVALFLAVAFAVFALIPMKNLRFTIMLDPVLRILAAWLLVSRGTGSRALAFLAAANAAIEFEIFRTAFVVHGVYDPVTETLLQALSAVPGSDPRPAAGMVYPLICAGLAALWWMLPRGRDAERGTAPQPSQSPTVS